MWEWIIMILSIIVGFLVIRFIYEFKKRDNSYDGGIISRASSIKRGACAKLKEKLFGC